jgi:hypothetical protein
MTERAGTRGKEMVLFLPDFIKSDLVDDAEFRAAIDLTVEGTLTLGDGILVVPQDAFHDAVASLYTASSKPQTIEAKDGRSVVVDLHPDRRDAIRLTVDDQVLFVRRHDELRPTAAERLAGFDKALLDADLPPAALGDWRVLLAERRLQGGEVQALEQELAKTPPAMAKALEATFESNTVSLDIIAPPHREYYECLVGRDNPADVAAMASGSATDQASDLIRSKGVHGAQSALLLSTHTLLLSGIDWSPLSDEDWVSLMDWAISEGDPFAQLGMVEIGLKRLAQQPELEERLTGLVSNLCALDPTDKHGPIHLLTGLFVVIDGELSRTRVLADWPPFRRRAASLAQAALVLRLVRNHIDADHFVIWALARDGRRFYLQSHVDLRLEPRWSPNYIEPAQWKAELMGRLNNAIAPVLETLKSGELHARLTGSEETDLPAQIRFPFSFQPGPLEGASAPGPASLPSEFEALLDESLANETLEPKSLAALINLQGLYSIPPDKAERAIALIKAAGHRFIGTKDGSEIDALLSGLARTSAISRSPELADQVRIMCRRRRSESQTPLSPCKEMLVALYAGAAHADRAAWSAFVGEWISEIAFALEDRADGEAMLADLDTLCTIAPVLRRTLCRAIAAIDSYVRS